MNSWTYGFLHTQVTPYTPGWEETILAHDQDLNPHPLTQTSGLRPITRPLSYKHQIISHRYFPWSLYTFSITIHPKKYVEVTNGFLWWQSFASTISNHASNPVLLVEEKQILLITMVWTHTQWLRHNCFPLVITASVFLNHSYNLRSMRPIGSCDAYHSHQ